MIISFSIPETPRYAPILNWYRSVDRNDRSREFREIFLSYLKKPHHTIDQHAEHHVSLEGLNSIKLDIIDLKYSNTEEDLDSKLDMIGVGEW